MTAPPRTYATAIEGRSLLPHLQGTGGHDEVIGEYLAEGAIAPIVMIRRGTEKFIHSPVDPDQLYDLGDDPDELVNLAAVPAAAETVAAYRVGDRPALGPGNACAPKWSRASAAAGWSSRR